MSETKIGELAAFGQSIWLDNISRAMIEDGRLKQMITSGLRGMTSNPSIFDKSISSSTDYDEAIKTYASRGMSTFDIYDELTVRDVRDAADMFRPVYEKTGGLDGYVSLEVNPDLAMKTEETVAECRRLHQKVNRPNVMFKVPATDAGFPAIEELLSDGINVNVTLIFSLDQYKKTAESYMKGMEKMIGKGLATRSVRSVASVFVSRIDTAVDRTIDASLSGVTDRTMGDRLKAIRGKAAIANAAIIYAEFLDIFTGENFRPLREKGVNLQRVLWGSTGTKDPTYSDIKYVTELIGKETVNTLPDKTLHAFIDHGSVEETLTGDAGIAKGIIASLHDIGVDISTVCLKLLEEGVTAFQTSFATLLASVERKKQGGK